MAPEISFIPEAIEKMANGASEERTQCPVCGNEKNPRSWICPECFKEHGYGLTLKVRQAVDRAVKKVDRDVWQKLLKISSDIFTSSARPDLTEEKLAERLLNRGDFQKQFPGVTKKTILDAFNQAQRWQVALAAVRNEFSDDESIDPDVFLDNPIRFGNNGNFITESMMRAACREVEKEREEARESAIGDAFLNGILKKKF